MKVFQGNHRPVYYYYLWLCVVCLLVVHNIQMSWYMAPSINLNCWRFCYFLFAIFQLKLTNIIIMLMTIRRKIVRLICFVQLDGPSSVKPCRARRNWTHIWPPTYQLFFSPIASKDLQRSWSKTGSSTADSSVFMCHSCWLNSSQGRHRYPTFGGHWLIYWTGGDLSGTPRQTSSDRMSGNECSIQQ